MKKVAASHDESTISTEGAGTSSNTPSVNYWFAAVLLVITAAITGLSSECMCEASTCRDSRLERGSQSIDQCCSGIFLTDRSLRAPFNTPSDLGPRGRRRRHCDGAKLDSRYCRSRDAPIASTGEEQLHKGIFLLACFGMFSLIAIAT